MSEPLDRLFDFFWQDYSRTTPDAPRIHDLLAARGEQVVNDHVAFRTYDIAPIALDSIARVFTRLGYQESGEYFFEEKKLHARSYRHPDPARPHVFISELLTAEFSPRLRVIADRLAKQVPAASEGSEELLTRLPSWSAVGYGEYCELLEESEYAAWLAVFGIRVNHFTVLVNALRTFGSIQDLNTFLQRAGFRLNSSGGLVKGSPGQLLEQSSTLANRVEWPFAGGERHVVPTCYYEFARRYVDPSTGELYAGFVARSADRIFESTDTRQSPQ